jgi:PAS domain S-box-containing protein
MPGQPRAVARDDTQILTGSADDGAPVPLPTPYLLVVDDTPANLIAFEAALEPLGYPIVLARSGRQALRHLLALDFSLILMDVNMPDLNGIDTVRLIKQSERHRHIPILFITALCKTLPFILRGYEVGAVDYVVKPVPPDVLRSKVAALVELFQQREIIRVQAALLREHERRAMERRSELRFRGLIDAMPSCVWAAADDGLFYYSNKAWAEYAGATSARGVGELIEEALHPDDRSRALSLWHEARRSGRPVEAQARLRRSDGAYRWHLVRAVPQRDSDRVAGWILTATDIDEQKRAEEAEHLAREQAEAANCETMKDEFLSTVSHELRTPLTPIVGWISMLRSGALSGAAAERALDVIARSAEAEKRVVEDILDVSRIVTGRLLIHLEPIDPAAAVHEVLDSLRPLARAKGVAFRCAVRSGGALLMGDADRLRRVVWKLVSNAIKFTPPGGRVDIRFEHLERKFLLEVSDTGEGISPDVLPWIFGCFTQEDRSSRRRHGGLGLGLAIARRLVELHGGSVRAESAGRGKGAVFTVELPAPAVALDRAPPQSHHEGGVLSGIRVLLVTDDADARVVMVEALEQRAATVIPVESAEDALGLVADSTPDVVVGDLRVKGVSSPSFLQRMDLDGRGVPPSIAIVECAEVERARQALSGGFRSCIAKPIHPAHLVAAIARFGCGGATPGAASRCAGAHPSR